ncbi:33383_t:CDS:2 [Gigaspora margarita]|uniref:33383_t:CDS:1 n=1 Tax=Gigaspora margarita TaxID=4874 RepID=A0ABN7VG71_GIGMA|nr:33383_t:CDS:2 [Gigaspora margarita]
MVQHNEEYFKSFTTALPSPINYFYSKILKKTFTFDKRLECQDYYDTLTRCIEMELPNKQKLKLAKELGMIEHKEELISWRACDQDFLEAAAKYSVFGMESAYENNGQLSRIDTELSTNKKRTEERTCGANGQITRLDTNEEETSPNMFDIKREDSLMKLSDNKSDSYADLSESDVLDDTFENVNHPMPNINSIQDDKSDSDNNLYKRNVLNNTFKNINHPMPNINPRSYLSPD